MAGLVLLLVGLTLSGAQEVLQDGVPTTVTIDSVTGGQLEFQFSLNETVVDSDLFLCTTTFSDWSSPHLYVSAGAHPSATSHNYTSSPQALEELEIPHGSIQPNTVYFVLAVCETYCRFSLLLTVEKEVSLEMGSMMRFSLDAGMEQVFVCEVREVVEELTIAVMPVGQDRPFYFTVTAGGISGLHLPTQNSWFSGQSCTIPSPHKEQYWVTIRALTSFAFYISAYEANGIKELPASEPEYGLVGLSHWQLYKLYIPDSNSTLYLQTTTYSGSNEIYLKAEGIPNLENYDLKGNSDRNETLAVDRHQRMWMNKTVGWYYVGVYGCTPSAYILTASLNPDGMVPLQDGATYSGYVSNSEKQYFYIPLNQPDDLTLSLTAQVLSGDLQMYIKLCTDWIRSDICKFTQKEIEGNDGVVRANSTGEFRLARIIHRGTGCQTGCKYTVLVLGKADMESYFLLTVSFEDDTMHSLRDGVPFTSRISSSHSLYFKLPVFDVRVTMVSFHLSVYTGQCSLCLSPYDDHPTSTECTKTAGKRGDSHNQNVEFVKGLDFDELNLTYYGTIQAQGYCSFALTSVQTLPDSQTVTKLFSGQSQRDVIWKNDLNVRVYSFELYRVEKDENGVDLSVMAFTGEFNVCVAVNVTDSLENFPCQWSEVVPTAQQRSISIHPTDPYYTPHGRYTVKIIATKWTSTGSASYLVVYTSGNSAVQTVEAGIPINSMVKQDSYRFYILPFPHLTTPQTLTISLSAVSGDPDLYVSLREPQPRIAHSEYKSEEYGSEQISVVLDDRLNVSGEVYVGVYGYTDAEYMLVVTESEVSQTYLVPGMGVEVGSEREEYRFFSSLVDVSLTLQISTQEYIGSTQIYLILVSFPSTNSTSFHPPSLTSYLFSSSSSPHHSQITLQPSQLLPFCSQDCRADISVLCISDTCRYSIELDQGQEIRLTDAVPQVSTCQQNTITRFRYHINTGTPAVQIAVTAISNGDPDLYISKKDVAGPESFMWKSVTWGNEFFVLGKENMGGELMLGDLHLGVSCDRDMSLTVLVRGSVSSCARVMNGQPYTGFVQKGNAEFMYFTSGDEDIVVTLTAESGQGTVYIISQNNPSDEMLTSKPSSSHFTWQLHPNESLTLPTSSLSCYLLLGAYSTTNSWLYTLLIRTKDDVTTLLNGRPSEGRVVKGESRKYVYENLERKGLEVALSRYSGNAEVVMATTPKVSIYAFNWTTSSYLSIPPSDPSFHLGLYYLEVFTTSHQSTYSLTLHSSNSTIKLVPGWPQTYSMPYLTGSMMFEYRSDGSQGSCKVISMTNGFYPVVYASFMEDGKEGERIHREFGEYDLFYELQVPLWTSKPGSYLLTLQSNSSHSASPPSMGTFELYCLPTNRTKEIVLGEVEFGVLDTDNPHQTFHLTTSEPGLLTILATPCSGKIEMTVKNTAESTQFTVKRVENGRLKAEFPTNVSDIAITVTGVEETELHDSVLFQLSTFLGVKGSRETLFYPGNEGEIQWTERKNHSIEVRWSPPVNDEGEVVSAKETVQYRVYVTQEQNVSLVSACSMNTYEARELAFQPHPAIYGSVSTLLDLPTDTLLWLNILALIDPVSTPELYEIAYTPIEIYLRTSSSDQSKHMIVMVFLGGTVVLLVIVLAILLVKYCKVKKLQVKLVDMLGVETVTLEFERGLKSARGRNSGFAPVSGEVSTS